jgi:hypothetical protein
LGKCPADSFSSLTLPARAFPSILSEVWLLNLRRSCQCCFHIGHVNLHQLSQLKNVCLSQFLFMTSESHSWRWQVAWWATSTTPFEGLVVPLQHPPPVAARGLRRCDAGWGASSQRPKHLRQFMSVDISLCTCHWLYLASPVRMCLAVYMLVYVQNHVYTIK